MSGIQTLVAAATPARPPHRPNRLLRAGLVAGPLFVAVFLVELAFHDGYDPMRHPVSSLSLGPGGWVQVLNFFVAGLLCLAFAAGLRRALRPGPGAAAAPLLLAVWAVGLLGAGAFVTDPVSGYPTGTPPVPDPPTWHGQLHDLAFSLPGFAAFAAAMFVLGYTYARRHAPWLATLSTTKRPSTPCSRRTCCRVALSGRKRSVLMKCRQHVKLDQVRCRARQSWTKRLTHHTLR